MTDEQQEQHGNEEAQGKSRIQDEIVILETVNVDGQDLYKRVALPEGSKPPRTSVQAEALLKKVHEPGKSYDIVGFKKKFSSRERQVTKSVLERV